MDPKMMQQVLGQLPQMLQRVDPQKLQSLIQSLKGNPQKYDHLTESRKAQGRKSGKRAQEKAERQAMIGAALRSLKDIRNGT